MGKVKADAVALGLGHGISTAPDDGPCDAERAFIRSMPHQYQELFDADAIAAHFAIVERRGASATRVEIWRELSEHVVGICVVAEDAPGLLSRVSAALIAHDVDVVAAQAYCRTRSNGEVEAVDFFWIRRILGVTGAVETLRATDVARIGETLDALVRGRASFDEAVRFARATRSVPHTTRVRFESEAHKSTVLTVEASDAPGLLMVIARTLYAQRLQIIRSEITTKDGVVRDRFHLTELDGAPLKRSRLLEIQTAVLGAIEEARAAAT